MPDKEPIVMPAGKFAGKPLTELESTYIVFTLEKTNLVGELKQALEDELYKRFFSHLERE